MKIYVGVTGAGLIMVVALAACGKVGSESPDLGAADQGGPGCAAQACDTEGITRCTGTQVQSCTLVEGCLTWSAASDCGADQLCCGSACVPADASNCYACGTSCSGTTPACLPAPKACGCSAQICAADQKDCDTATGNCVVCQTLPAGASDFYVDASATATPTGSLGCPFKTISAALTAANASTAISKTIHLAAGTYDAAAGETFPLKLRNGISLVGAGANTTIIKGTGTWNADTESAGALIGTTYQVTLAIGDPATAQTVSGVTLRPNSGTPVDNVFGIVCDRGNTAPLDPVPASFPDPTLLLSGSSVGPGYSVGLAVTNYSSTINGCNAKVTASTFTGNWTGIWVVGCGTGRGSATAAAQVGDGSAAGANSFIGHVKPDRFGFGVLAWDCTSPVRVLRNTFDQGDTATNFSHHDTKPILEFSGNTVTAHNRNGVWAGENALFTLNDNTITGVVAPNASGLVGAAVFLGGGVGNAAQVKQARRNKLVGNEQGLVVHGPAFTGTRTQLDFGTAADPGMNTFSCNSAASGAGGWDVVIQVAASSTVALPFQGNSWDHYASMSPTISTSNVAANGTDLVNLSAATAPVVEVQGGNGTVAACVVPRVAGP